MMGKDLTSKVYAALDVCLETKQLKHGILSEGTAAEVKSPLMKLLCKEGLYYEEAQVVINQLWLECQPALTGYMKALDKNTKELFQTLKNQGMKIAICTGDERHTVLRDLNKLGLMSYVDMMVCGDDPHSEPMPSAHNTLLICDEMSVSPSQTAVIGDSIGDLSMAKNANVGTTIGVLTGVGSRSELDKYADHIVSSVGDALQHIGAADSDTTRSVPLEQRSPKGQRATVRTYSTGTTSKKGFGGNQSRAFSTSTVSRANTAATYDYVIVGAGSAGCVLSNRLSANPDNKVPAYHVN
jgi:phosphoglycolate phosphatase-like HAD superfamily hydrolase